MGREVSSSELEEREKVLEDLQGARGWMEAADLRLAEPEPDLQVLYMLRRVTFKFTSFQFN